ncbi:MAG: DUF1841 family protein [Planctomycetota bacterium]
MGLREAELAMSALKASQSFFDYAKTQDYVACVQAYVEAKIERCPGSHALVDPSGGTIKLPPQLNERVDRWMQDHPEYSPFMRTFARHYLIDFLADTGEVNPYEHLAQCVKQGCNFYVENGAFYLQDAAAVFVSAPPAGNQDSI